MDNKMPLISIIVPVYNVEKYVRECLESIKKQSYRNIEVLMVNDESTDKSPEICKEYEKKDKRFKLYNKKNGGLSDARNYGLGKMRGEYVCFVDSDDIISTRLVEFLLIACLQKDSQISFCRYRRFIDEVNDDVAVLPGKIGEIKKQQFLLNTYYQLDKELYAVSAWAKLYNAAIFKDIRYRKDILYEDFDIIDEAVNGVEELSFVDVVLYFYRNNNTGITRGKYSEKHNDVIRICNRLLEKYKNDTKMFRALTVMKFTRCIEILTKRTESHVDFDKNDSLYRYIIENRKLVLKDSNTRWSVKLAALLSYISLRLVFRLNVMRRRGEIC